jgi:hypothetical protein
MIIANPMYDVPFGRLMENQTVLKFFASTLLEKEVESVRVIKPEPLEPEKLEKFKSIVDQVMSLYLVVSLRNSNIKFNAIVMEFHKIKGEVSLLRLMEYAALQFSRADAVAHNVFHLAFIPFYLLGFNLKNVETSYLTLYHNLVDHATGKVLKRDENLLNYLAPDPHFIQAGRVDGNCDSTVNQLLSVFEQNHFIDEKKITKQYPHEPDLEEVKTMVHILNDVATNPKWLSQLEAEAQQSPYSLTLATQNFF